MKTEEILGIEESGENRINLVRGRLFWQAWNRNMNYNNENVNRNNNGKANRFSVRCVRD